MKVVLITGGTRGIGKGIAAALAAKGKAVIVTSRHQPFVPGLQPVAGEAVVQNLDVQSEKSVERLFAWLDTQSCKLEILVNNAGIGVFKPLCEIAVSEWRNIIDVNLTGAFLCSRAAAQRMIPSGGGRIINIGSIVDKKPLPGNSAYGTSKWGLRGFSRTVAEESKNDNLRVTHVSLGAVYTEIWEGRDGFKREDMLSISEAAEAISHIASLPLSLRIDEIEITPGKGTL